MCYWSLDLKFKAKLKLQSGNRKIQHGHQAAILKMTLLKINRLLFIYTSDVPLKFGLIFKAKLKLDSGKKKIKDGRQAAILTVTLLKINTLLPMVTNNMHIKLEIEIPKQTWVMLRKPCRLQTDVQTDRQTNNVNPVYPPPTSLGRSIKILLHFFWTLFVRNIFDNEICHSSAINVCHSSKWHMRYLWWHIWVIYP